MGLALALFTYTFRGERRRFWHRMTGTALTLGAFSLAAEPETRRIRLGFREILIGLSSAGILYGVFQIADRLVRKLLPMGSTQIEEIYQLEQIRPRWELVARLGLLIAPAEELFWRGFLQRGFVKRFGRWTGALLVAVMYAGVHVSSGNLTLIGAAAVVGLFWGGLRALGVPLSALIVSHVVWDILIFLIAPTARPSKPRTA
jgi:hypothetical protein